MEQATPAIKPENIRVIYVRGISKHATRKIINNVFSKFGGIARLEFDENNRRGFLWLEYEECISAHNAVRELHNTDCLGCMMSVRLEQRALSDIFSVVPASSAAVDGSNLKKRKGEQQYERGSALNTLGGVTPRMVKKVATVNTNNNNNRGTSSNKQETPHVSYTSSALQVNDTLYPIPTGKYLMKLIHMMHQESHIRKNAPYLVPLLGLLSERRFGNKQAKELSESFAMVNGLFELGRKINVDWRQVSATVFVLADGVVPYTAAALALTLALFNDQDAAEASDKAEEDRDNITSIIDHWNFITIDPLLEFNSTANFGASSPFASRFTTHKCLAQEYDISSASDTGIGIGTHEKQHVYVILACHSHAPLQEFMDRLGVHINSKMSDKGNADVTPLASRRFCVTMPCCNLNWSNLETAPVAFYEDYEVFSARRSIFLYADQEVDQVAKTAPLS